MKELYNMIFKRKSMRRFDETLSLTEKELADIEQKIESLTPLVSDIKVKFKMVKRAETTSKRGEYCLLMYSEKKPHYLLNAGYLLEQMDLFLTSLDIGACWYGMAKPKEPELDGLDYVIMLAFGKSRPQDFRKSPSEFKRKSKEEIWTGDFDKEVIEAVRLAPSACNTQPARFVSGVDGIKVYRGGATIKSFIPVLKLPFYNSVDLGISLCFLETAMAHKGFQFERRLIAEENLKSKLLETAEYSVKQP